MEKTGSGSCIMNLSMQLTAPSYTVTSNLLLNSSHFTSKLYGSQITARMRSNLFCDYRAYWVLHRSSPAHLVSRALESHSPPADSVECSFRINPIIQRRRRLRQKYHPYYHNIPRMQWDICWGFAPKTNEETKHIHPSWVFQFMFV